MNRFFDKDGKEIYCTTDETVTIGGGERRQVYEVLCEKCTGSLERAVNRHLSKGAALVGGPFESQGYLLQAILRYEEEVNT